MQPSTNFSWGPAYRALRDDVNTLTWLLAEEKHNKKVGACEIVEEWHGKAGPRSEGPTP